MYALGIGADKRDNVNLGIFEFDVVWCATTAYELILIRVNFILIFRLSFVLGIAIKFESREMERQHLLRMCARNNRASLGPRTFI